MYPSQSERGAALQAVLLLTLVISLGLIALLTIVLAQVRFLETGRRLVQLRYHAESGITELLFALQSGRQPPDTAGDIPWQLAGGDSCRVSAVPWGAFYRLSAKAQAGPAIRMRSALAGYRTDERFAAALRITPARYSLAVCGDTRLYGDVFTGPAGVRPEPFHGRSYSGEPPVYGNISRNSTDQQQQLNREVISAVYRRQQALLLQPATQTLREWIGRTATPSGLPEEPVVQLSQPELDRSPGAVEGPVTLLAEGDIVLRSGWIFRRFVRIIAGGSIRIEPGVRLSNSLCFSPESIALQGVQAENLQLIAGRGIDIAGASQITGNSLLLCANPLGPARINLYAGVQIAGTVCLDAAAAPPGEDPGKLLIGEAAEIRGTVFAHPLLELRGNVYGTVLCSGFHFYSSPTHYYNRIIDGIIDRRDAELRFVPLFFNLPESLLTLMEYVP